MYGTHGKSHHKFWKCIVLTLAVALIVIISSCPNPIDGKLAFQVEDETAPIITITTPDLSETFYYPAVIVVEGIVSDFADSAGQVQGSVRSLHYEEQYDKRVQGDVDVASDGTFTFNINTYGPPKLEGTLYIVVTATDWNDNIEEITIPAFDKTTGPDITMLGETPGLYHYSSALHDVLYFYGIVDPSAIYLRYNMENPEGTIRISDRAIPFDQITGEFAVEFDPDSPSVSGDVTFILEASDGLISNRFFYVNDDPDPPQFDAASEVGFDNTYVDLVFSEGIYHTGGTDPNILDFTAVAAPVDAAVLGGFTYTPTAGDSSVRLSLSVSGIPTGSETIHITAENITDKVGNALTPAGITLKLSDKTVPQLVRVRTDVSYIGNAYTGSDSIPIKVEFSEPVTASVASSLLLSTGRSAGLSAGDGTAELTFIYDVQAGDNTVPPAYLNAASLNGTFTDEGLNALSNPALPGSPNDLAAMQITIDTEAPARPVVTIVDTDGMISKAENLAGVPFQIEGEALSNYAIVLGNCYKASGPALSGQMPAGVGSTLLSGFTLKTNADSGLNATVSVTLTDVAGNDSLAGSDSVLIATASPQAPVFITAEHHTNDPDITWNWKSGGGGNGTYRCELNDSDLSSGSTQTSLTSYNEIFTTDGLYTLYVEEQNDYGNWSDAASRAITLDRVAPDVDAPADIAVAATGEYGIPATNSAIAAFLSGATANDDVDGSLSVNIGSYPATFPVGTTAVNFSATDAAANSTTVSADVTVENTVFAPNGGETWAEGTTHEITWAHDDSDTVKIELYKGGILHTTIDATATDDGTYSWLIPNGFTPGSDYRIRITDGIHPLLYDQSDGTFAIENITVTVPNGGQVWGAGSTRSIAWSSSGTGNVKIELDKGGSVSEIDSVTANDGSFSWSIPSDMEPGNDYTIAITHLSAPAASDQSDNDFSITVTVGSPNGGESWRANTSNSITWAGIDSGKADIELYKGGVKDSDIATNINNDGTYWWSIPSGQTPGTDYSVRITTRTTPPYTDDSDASFTITAP